MPHHWEAEVIVTDKDNATARESFQYETARDATPTEAARAIKLHLQNTVAPGYGKATDVADPEIAPSFNDRS